MIYGIDEAGRGPLLGPMVVAVVGMNPAALAFFGDGYLQDSKAYGSSDAAKRKRAVRFGNLVSFRKSGLDAETADSYPDPVVQCSYIAHFPDQIDAAVNGKNSGSGGLNYLEQNSARRQMQALGVDPGAEIWADGANLFGPLRTGDWYLGEGQPRQYRNLRAVNNGESAHVTVAAASIIAKHIRDSKMAEIEQKYAALGYSKITGGGYVNAGTRKFLAEYAARNNGELPPEARKSWKLSV